MTTLTISVDNNRPIGWWITLHVLPVLSSELFGAGTLRASKYWIASIEHFGGVTVYSFTLVFQ
jgi:hypothetical protein